MVDIVIKVLNSEIAVGNSPNTVFDSSLLRVYTPATGSDSLISIKSANGSIIGTMTQSAGLTEIINKLSTDTIQANTSIRCVPVSWK